MPLLNPTDPLPGTPRRILVAGTSGSGKTTLARQIAELLHIPHVEIDALYHGPQWTPRAEFADDVAALVATPAWVTEWQYSEVRPLLADATDVLVWLDLSRWRVLWQLTRRTLRRGRQREELWNGNIEPPLRTFFTDRDHIVRWAWRTHPGTASRVTALLAHRPALPIVRLPSHAAASAWMSGPLTQASRPSPTPLPRSPQSAGASRSRPRW